MKNLGNITHPKDIVTKDYVDNLLIGKSDKKHSHEIADVFGLQVALEGMKTYVKEDVFNSENKKINDKLNESNSAIESIRANIADVQSNIPTSIDGSNLIRNSIFINGLKYFSKSGNHENSSIINISKFPNENSLFMRSTGVGGKDNLIQVSPTTKVPIDTELVFSFWARGYSKAERGATIPLHVEFWGSDGVDINIPNDPYWRLHYVKIKKTKNFNNDVNHSVDYLYFWLKEASEIYITRLKLEQGSIATGWLLAIEDNTENNEEIKQKLSSIESNVDNLKETQKKVDSLSVGRWNLLDGGNNSITNNAYPTATYDITDLPVVGDTYTVTLKGSLGKGKNSWGIYNSGGDVHLVTLKDMRNGYYEGTFQWKNIGTGGIVDSKTLKVFPFINTVTTQSTIEWITLTKGTVGTTEWIPAKSEMLSKTGNLIIGKRNYVVGSANMIVGTGSRESGTFRKSGPGTIETVTMNDIPVPGVNKAIKISGSGTGIAQNALKLTVGEWVVSYWVKGTKGDTIRIQAYWASNNDTSGVGPNVVLDTNEWTRISLKVKNSVEGIADIAYVYTYSNNPLWVTAPQLEQGNTLSDWANALEDVQSQIDTSVSSADVEYYLSTSTTSLSGGSWQTTAPQWVQGKYMWSRTKVTFNNGQIRYTPNENGTCISGAQGERGTVNIWTGTQVQFNAISNKDASTLYFVTR